MKSPSDDGGPAFPHEQAKMNYDGRGMSLRDWFAGQALAGIMACRELQKDIRADRQTWQAAAYEMADAMLEARK